MPTTQPTNPTANPLDDDLTKTTILASLRQLDEEQLRTISQSQSPDNTLLDIILESIRLEFTALRIDNTREQEAGNHDLFQEIKEVAKAVFTRGKRGDVDARGQYEFQVMADKGQQRRKVIIDISLTEIQIRAKGVAAQAGKNGIVKEVGQYVKHARRPKKTDTGTVNHYITGKFAPASEGEVLVLIDNSLTGGVNGINYIGHAIRPRTGTPRQIQIGEGVRKEILAPAKFQLIANRTGVVGPIYDLDGNLRIIDVQESVQVSEVGLREGGHVAIKGTDGNACELDIEDTNVDSVGRAFKIRTSGTVTVKETIYGEVIADNVKALMVNAEGKIVAARNTIMVGSALQTSTLHARNISIGRKGKQGSVINSTIRARHQFSATDVRFLGRNTIVLGSDIARENDTIVFGTDLFANRQGTTTEQRSLQNQVDNLMEEIRQGLAQQVKKQKNAVGTDFRTLLATISASEQAFGNCPAEEEDQRRIELNNALADLGILDTMGFLNLFAAKKKLDNQLREATSQLDEISPPLTLNLKSVSLNDGAQLLVKCWRDAIMITRVEQEIIISREKQEKDIFRGKTDKLTVELSFDYQSNKLTCSKPS